jgi:muramoyltetrapeptide carboxypeptidase
MSAANTKERAAGQRRVRYPTPLEPGDVIDVTSPSSGVSEGMRPRLDFSLEYLRQRGYEVVVGNCMDGNGATSAPAAQRAAELSAMLTDPQVRAVVPPWGGELALDLLPLLDFDAIATAEPTWLVGYSDISTLTLPLTLRTGMATMHAPNLMDTAYEVPDGLRHWLDVASAPGGSTVKQSAAPLSRGARSVSIRENPSMRDWELSVPSYWKQLGTQHPLPQTSASGRLLGGCLETVAMLPGTAFGDVAGFARDYAPEGLLVYLEVAESTALSAARLLAHLRLAGWLDHANAVLIGRSTAPASGSFTQLDALRFALDGLDVPVLYDIDFGHVPPQMALVNGALATVTLAGTAGTLVQSLV